MIKNDPKIINAWCTYDWANSVYSLTITTAIFPEYFLGITNSEANHNLVDFFGFLIPNTVLYSWAVSIVFLVAAILSPFLTSIADYSGMKKTFMKVSCYTGAVSCAALYFFNEHTIEFGVLAFVLAGIGYSSSIVFYNSYLPEIATEDQYDRISAKGYTWGYIGSVLLLIINLVCVVFHEKIGITSSLAARLAFLTVGVWWLVFGQISFMGLPKVQQKNNAGHMLTNGLIELNKVWKNIQKLPLLKRFLVGFFFYNMGVQTVMYLAPLFAKEVIHIEQESLIATILLIQLVAIAGAYALNILSNRVGNTNALMAGVVVWIAICCMAYVVKPGVSFFILAGTIGFVMGGVQSLSRATYSKLMPVNTKDHASYFSFFDVVDKMSIVLGTFSYGLIRQVTGDMRNSLIALGIYFVISIFFLRLIPSKQVYDTQLPD
ncbi:MFS transporter [Cytophaga aurantiaca]|uniref:MFS transporter n=1 Tax=Cytophaga aurantiaca TaxID=29530 RepID=UPI00036585D0|nr:MFS transporter [Cytophaga aurantiaca]